MNHCIQKIETMKFKQKRESRYRSLPIQPPGWSSVFIMQMGLWIQGQISWFPGWHCDLRGLLSVLPLPVEGEDQLPPPTEEAEVSKWPGPGPWWPGNSFSQASGSRATEHNWWADKSKFFLLCLFYIHLFIYLFIHFYLFIYFVIDQALEDMGIKPGILKILYMIYLNIIKAIYLSIHSS